MIVFLLAGVIDGNGGAPPSGGTLAGLALGTTLANVSTEHPGGQLRRNGAGSRWTWKRPGGGTVIVLLDNAEKVVEVTFMTDRGEADGVDLPCVKNFPVQDSHINLEAALDQTECAPIGNDKYRLRDGSILEVAFGGSGDGPLQIARWHNPGARKAAWLPAQVAVTVFDCLPDVAAPPELRISDIDRIFAADSIAPRWTFKEPVWKVTISIPAGHYIFDAHTKHCSGESEQLVAIPGHTRNVTMTLDERQQVIRVDEDMHASAVYGLLPSAPARVELMSADSLIGEQTRQTARIDGGIYEFDHLRPGSYVLRVIYGDIVVSRSGHSAQRVRSDRAGRLKPGRCQ